MKSAYALLFCTLIVAGCDRIVGDRVTGLGRLDGAHGRASFGFNADNCDPTPTGQVQYDDHDREVKFHGDVVDVRQCNEDLADSADCPVCDPLRVVLGFPPTGADYEVEVTYRSTNPDDPGEGTAHLCFTDNGEGVNATSSDNSIVSVKTGPPRYVGYLNFGPIRGNIQQHECPSG